MRTFTLLVVLGLVVSPLVAQEAADKLHPQLTTHLMGVSAATRVPVYFVMSERLGYEHWFPRVLRMSLDERRATVIRECQAHALRTQRDVLATLEAAAPDCVGEVKPNWLANIVRCEATPAVILQAAALKSVSEVWLDIAPPLSEVEDGASIPSSAASAPGNGPLNTKADQVWALNINGSGVVVMNADSGINVTHSDLASRLWVNAGEIAGNGIDDDGNGKIDDVNGWSFATNNNSLSDSGGHGTNTAGCLVGDGTCSGVVYGQAPGAKVMTARLSGESSQWDALAYAVAQGAHCQTSSHSYKHNTNPNYKIHRQVGDTTWAAGLIRTNSTSNNGTFCNSTTSTVRKPFNISAPGCLPSPYMDPNQTLQAGRSGVLGVGAHDLSNNLVSYSPCGPFAWYLPDAQIVNTAFPSANWDPVNHNDYPWTGGTQMALLKPDMTSPTGTTTTSGTGTCGTTTFSGTSNATPVANGVLCLWKSANMSLTPEDAAMIVHQTSMSSGSVPGKENNWGAGRIDALEGTKLALCVHRVNGDPAWTVNHQVGTNIDLALDGVPNSVTVLGVGTQRMPGPSHGGVVGVGGSTLVLDIAATDSTGAFNLNLMIPPTLSGLTFFTQGFIVDGTYFNTVLSSNVIGITFVP
jgi:hypothetical protein